MYSLLLKSVEYAAKYINIGTSSNICIVCVILHCSSDMENISHDLKVGHFPSYWDVGL